MTRPACRRWIVCVVVGLFGLTGCTGTLFTHQVTIPDPVVVAKSSSKSKSSDIVQAGNQEPTEQLPPPRVMPPASVDAARTNASCGPTVDATGRMLPGPTATGCLLNLSPTETAFERAVELAKRLEIVEGEKWAMALRVQQLESAVEARDQLLSDSNREVEQASTDVTATREELRAIRKELATLSVRAKQMEKADVESLKSILSSLQKLLEPPEKSPRP